MPGVPPDALAQVKRVFKGMFKRGNKKNKSTQFQQVPKQSQQPTTDPSAAPPPSSRLSPTQQLQRDDFVRQSRIPDKPPQLDHPISSGSPLRAEESTSPLDNKPAASTLTPNPAPAPNVGSGLAGVQQAKEEERAGHDVSPAEHASSADAAGSAPVSALEDGSSMMAPSKAGRPSEDTRPGSTILTSETSGAGVGSLSPYKITNPERPVSRASADNVTDATPQKQYSTKAAQMLDPKTAAGMAEQPKTNGEAIHESRASDSTIEPPATPAKNDVEEAKPAVDGNALKQPRATEATKVEEDDIMNEKMPVLEELPDIKPVKAAPGMSATSGPLEDFFPGSVDGYHDDGR